MIKAIKELGEIKIEKEKKDLSNPINILIQNPNENGKYPYVLLICFDLIKSQNDDELIYKKINIEKTSNEKILKYLYRRSSSQGANFTPSCLTTKDIEKTFKNRIEGWFKHFKEIKDKLYFEIKTDDEKYKIELPPIFKLLYNSYNKNKKRILDELKGKWYDILPQLRKEESTGVVLSIGFLENDNIKYLGDFKEFQKFLIETKILKFKEIKKDKHKCSICDNEGEVYGNALSDIFKFYTLDKPGYIAGGFERLNAWKNFPVCFDCFLKIEEGKNFLDEYLSFKMAGNSYYLIPKFIIGKDETKEILSNFFSVIEKPRDTLSEVNRISEDEKEIIEELGKLKDLVNFNFMFFERQKGSPTIHRITLLVEDILPSRISKIFEAKKEAEKYEIFKNIKISKNKFENINFRFDVLKRFSPSQKSFLEIVDKTFRGIRIDITLLLSWFMNYTRRNFIKKVNFKPLVLQAFVALLFFKKSQLLDVVEYNIKQGGFKMTELKEKTEEFFRQYEEIFSTSIHKSVFLLGVLTQKLLNIQLMERNSTPFRKNLKGLRMNERDFKGLLTKVINKLEEYGKNYYRSLESLISEYFIEAGKNWKINSDELNFYFTLGMSLEDRMDEVLNLTKKEDVHE